MKKNSLLLMIALAVTLLPGTTHAQETNEADPYADVVTKSSNQIINPTRALGAPDQLYSDILEMDHEIQLDMGEGEEGLGDLKLYYHRFSIDAVYSVKLVDSNGAILTSATGFFPTNEGFITIPYVGETPYRYVLIRNGGSNQQTWGIDAVEAASYLGMQDPNQTTDEDTDTTTDTQESPAMENPERGFLVKLHDDGDPLTTYDSTIYVVGANNTRHAFPTSDVFFSWYENFDHVLSVNEGTMASYTLGPNVTIRPGTSLVKLTTDPKTYAVEPGGVLRWITSEDIAKKLYGERWADRVVDMPDVFFGNYTKGPDITSTIHPAGTFGYGPQGQVVYVRNSLAYTVSGDVYESMRFARSEFLTPITATIYALYVDAGPLGEDSEIQYPY